MQKTRRMRARSASLAQAFEAGYAAGYSLAGDYSWKAAEGSPNHEALERDLKKYLDNSKNT